MKRPRRNFLLMVVSLAVSAAARHTAQALDYPTRPIRLIVPFPANGPADIAGRLLAQALSQRLGRQVVVENRTGAGGNIGTEAVARAPADGYTLLLAGAAAAFSPSLYPNLNYNFLHDIAPVAGFMRLPNVMLINPSLPPKTVPEFIAYAKANPGRINMGTGGNGTTQHIFGELFNMMAGVDLVPVAYRGGAPALIDLLAGRVQVMFDPLSESVAHVQSGKLRALAVTSAARLRILPDVPTVGEFLPEYEASGFFGVCAPHGTPATIVDTLNRDIITVLENSEIQARIASLGGTPLPMTPAQFGKLVAGETEKWGRVIRAANIRSD